MIDNQTTRGLIASLEAFKGRDADEYRFLFGPLEEIMYQNQFYNLRYIGRLAEAILANVTPTGRRETTHTETKPSVTTQFLADQIKPWIEDIRQTLFYSRSAPFNRIEDAQTWWDDLIKRFNEWHSRLDEWHSRVDEWHRRMDEGDEWRKRREQRHDPWGMEGLWSVMRKKYPQISMSIDMDEWKKLPLDHPARLEAGEPPELDEQVMVLTTLVDPIFEVSKATDFTLASVTMHILANAPLVLPPLSYGIIDRPYSLPSGSSIRKRFATVTIRSDVTFEELRSAYRSIRRELGITRSKSHTTKHLQLYQIVRERGNVPRGKGTVAFWESVRHEWNERYAKPKYTTWKGVKAAYDRLYRKMGDRFQGIPSEHNSTALDVSYVRKQKEAHNERTRSQAVQE